MMRIQYDYGPTRLSSGPATRPKRRLTISSMVFSGGRKLLDESIDLTSVFAETGFACVSWPLRSQAAGYGSRPPSPYSKPLSTL